MSIDQHIKENQVVVVLEKSDNNQVGFQVLIGENPPEDEELKRNMELIYLVATGIVAQLSMPGEMSKALKRGQQVLQAAGDLQEYGDGDSAA